MKEHPGTIWLNEHFNEAAAKCPNEWVALDGNGIVAHDQDLKKVMQASDPRKVAFAYIDVDIPLP